MAHPRRKSKRKAQGIRGPNEWHDSAAQNPALLVMMGLDHVPTNEDGDHQ